MKLEEPCVIERSLFVGERSSEVSSQGLGDVGGLDFVQLASIDDALDL
jgi:hypothetical protein